MYTGGNVSMLFLALKARYKWVFKLQYKLTPSRKLKVEFEQRWKSFMVAIRKLSYNRLAAEPGGTDIAESIRCTSQHYEPSELTHTNSFYFSLV